MSSHTKTCEWWGLFGSVEKQAIHFSIYFWKSFSLRLDGERHVWFLKVCMRCFTQGLVRQSLKSGNHFMGFCGLRSISKMDLVLPILRSGETLAFQEWQYRLVYSRCESMLQDMSTWRSMGVQPHRGERRQVQAAERVHTNSTRILSKLNQTGVHTSSNRSHQNPPSWTGCQKCKAPLEVREDAGNELHLKRGMDSPWLHRELGLGVWREGLFKSRWLLWRN